LNQGEGTFGEWPSSPVYYSLSGRPFALTTVDRNEDGHSDLVVARISANMMSVMLGTGNGVFADPVDFPVASPSAITHADVNEDGHEDIVVTNDGTTDRVTVKLGNGSGSFFGETDYPVGWAPQSVSLADINEDDHLDIVVGNINSENYSVLLGVGDGTFGATTDYDVEETSISAIHLRDFSEDGIPDLVVANEHHSNLSFHLGTGQGTFGDAPVYATGQSPRSIACADFNEDGNLDFVIGRPYYVDVLLGNGAGEFSSATQFPAYDQNSVSFACGDFNEDGHQDVAIANLMRYVSVLLGTGTGEFGAVTVDSTGASTSTDVVSADFNEDGHLDLAVSNDVDKSISIMLGSGTGSFARGVPYEICDYPACWPNQLTAADFNGDSHADLAITHGGSSDSISVVLGTGTGSFQPVTNYSIGGVAPLAITHGDFNEDGNLDLATANYSSRSLTILLGDGLGDFQFAQSTYVGNAPFDIIAADINGDSHLDLTVADETDDGRQIAVLLGSGIGTFEMNASYGTRERPYQMVTGDFDRDTHLDLAAVNWAASGAPGYVSIFFGRAPMVVSPPQAVNDLTIAPINGIVELRWTPVTLDILGNPIAVSYYRIWRSLTDFDSFALYDSTENAVYQDPESSSNDAARFYAVTAVQ
ncbi:MAG: VCBS repeat-containing protein, partial [bacterium]|nr:VCBS repeat-containing protein [bacterium]